MQTFLPYGSFYDTARTLDDKRLGKQRVEALQILIVIAKPVDYVGGWVNHPVVNLTGMFPTICLTSGLSKVGSIQTSRQRRNRLYGSDDTF